MHLVDIGGGGQTKGGKRKGGVGLLPGDERGSVDGAQADGRDSCAESHTHVDERAHTHAHAELLRNVQGLVYEGSDLLLVCVRERESE